MQRQPTNQPHRNMSANQGGGGAGGGGSGMTFYTRGGGGGGGGNNNLPGSSSSGSGSNRPRNAGNATQQQQQQPATGSVGPNEPNPVLANYQNWANSTPLITRLSIIAVISMYLLSWLLPLEKHLANVPYLTIQKFEIYRLICPSLVGDSFFNIIILMLFYPRMALQMETSLGSLHFAYLMFFLSLLINLTFDFVCYLLYFMGDPASLAYDCSSFWVITFALLTISSMQTPEAPRQIMFIPINIPSKYMPLALYGFFCIFSGLQLDFFLAIVAGYLHSQNYFAAFIPSSEFLQNIEGPQTPQGERLDGGRNLDGSPLTSCLSAAVRPVTQLSGFISASSAAGFAVYSGLAQSEGSSHGGGYDNDQSRGGGQTSGGSGSMFDSSGANSNANPGRSSFAGTGYKLGSSGSSTSTSSSSSSSIFAPSTNTSRTQTQPSREEIIAKRLAALSGNNTTTSSNSNSKTGGIEFSSAVAAETRNPMFSQTSSVFRPGVSTHPEPSHINVNDDNLRSLMEMGFDQHHASTALMNAGGDLEMALQILTSQP